MTDPRTCCATAAMQPMARAMMGRVTDVIHPPNEVVIGRYHSLYVERESVPEVLAVTASTEDGVPMAIEHKSLPVGGVQFHPESLMSLGGEIGLRIVENAFRLNGAMN